MNCKEIIENRRSIRKFLDVEVKKENIIDILNCGRLAPSAKNRQPWSFVVVNGELKNKIADLMIDDCINNYSDNKNTVEFTAGVIKKANVLILVFKNSFDNSDDILSLGACVQNMLLRATELDLGSLWISDCVYVKNEVKLLVNNDNDLASMVALGFKDQEPKQRPRFDLEGLVDWNYYF